MKNLVSAKIESGQSMAENKPKERQRDSFWITGGSKAKVETEMNKHGNGVYFLNKRH